MIQCVAIFLRCAPIVCVNIFLEPVYHVHTCPAGRNILVVLQLVQKRPTYRFQSVRTILWMIDYADPLLLADAKYLDRRSRHDVFRVWESGDMSSRPCSIAAVSTFPPRSQRALRTGKVMYDNMMDASGLPQYYGGASGY